MNDSIIICLFCGHEHPSSAENCPSCGRAPIDTKLTPAHADEPVQLGFATEPPSGHPAEPEETTEPEPTEAVESAEMEAATADASAAPAPPEPMDLAAATTEEATVPEVAESEVAADPASADFTPSEHEPPARLDAEEAPTAAGDTSAADMGETEPLEVGALSGAAIDDESVDDGAGAKFDEAMFAAMTEWPEDDLDWMSPQGDTPELHSSEQPSDPPNDSAAAETSTPATALEGDPGPLVSDEPDGETDEPAGWQAWKRPPMALDESEGEDSISSSPTEAIDVAADATFGPAVAKAPLPEEPEAPAVPEIPTVSETAPAAEPGSPSQPDAHLAAEELVPSPPPPESEFIDDDEGEWFDPAAPDAVGTTAAASSIGRRGVDSTAAETAAAGPADMEPAPRVAPSPGGGDARSGARRARRSPQSRSQSLVVGLVVLAVIVGWFLVLNQISRDDTDPGTIAGSDVVVSSTGLPATTIDEPTATTTPADDGVTTSAAPTTTTSTVAPVPDIEAVGDPIAIADLGLGAFALGPLDFGSTDALGRLVATFGPPDTYEEITGAFGLCEGDTGFTTSWGPFTAVFAGAVDAAELAGYRQSSGGGDHPATELTTLSGLSAGDTVADLKTVYQDFIVSLEDNDDGSRFILTRSSDAATLLWGPVSATDDTGTVLGIYSPNACDGGPAPTP